MVTLKTGCGWTSSFNLSEVSSSPRVDVDVRSRSQLGRPLVDLLLQARRLQRGADVFLHRCERRHGQSALPPFLRIRPAVVRVDLVGGDHDHRCEALLDVVLDLQLALDQRAQLVERQFRSWLQGMGVRQRGGGQPSSDKSQGFFKTLMI
jgi:hypothetical protein